LAGSGTSVAPPCADAASGVSPTREAQVDFEIEVEELKGRRRNYGKIAIGALVTCALALVLRLLA